MKNDKEIRLYIPFKEFYGEEIKHIAKYSCTMPHVNLSKFITNGNELYMSGNTYQTLSFIHVDNSKPEFYSELECIKEVDFSMCDSSNNIIDFSDNYKIVEKHNRPKTIAYKFPFYETTEPEKLIASKTSSGLFSTTVLEYTKVKESTRKEIDYDRVEEIIYEVLEKYNAFSYKN